MSKKAENVIYEEYESALRDLLECYVGSPPILNDPGVHRVEVEMTGVVGLSDKSISGSVTLSTCQETAGRMAETSPMASADWLGELCNQLAGRLKNKLLAYDLCPNLSTPAVICGKHLRISSLARHNYAFRIESELGVIESQLLLDTPDDLELTLNPLADAAVEGSLQLF